MKNLSIKQRRTQGDIENLRAVFDAHQGGVTKPILLLYTEIPESRLSHALVTMRKRATELEHIPCVLKIGGEWIYGWAETMREHFEEHLKRARNEMRRLKIDVPMIEQSIVEHPDRPEFRDRLRRVQHQIEDIEAEMLRLAGALTKVRVELEGIAA